MQLKQVVVSASQPYRADIKAVAAENGAQVIVSPLVEKGRLLIFDDSLFFIGEHTRD